MAEKKDKALPKQGAKALMNAWSKANADMISAKKKTSTKKK